MSDLISRQALCEYALNQKDKSVTPNDIMRFPSAQPERKGKWINIRHDNIAECDQCGITGRAWMNFCFDCGADMRGET